MEQTKYLIAGSSHAALAAVNAIRMLDTDGSLTMVTRDDRLPYSPTVLPYVVSGQSRPDRVQLRDDAYFAEHKVTFLTGKALTALDTESNTVTLNEDEKWRYEKLLLATGAQPAIPPIPGLADLPYYVLRSMDEAVSLRDALVEAKSAIVLGGGLIGMHAAENVIQAGLDVTIVEMLPQVLPGYFDPAAAEMIQRTFADNGADMRIGDTVIAAAKQNDRASVTLDSGAEIAADLLLVCTGVTPSIGYLEGTSVDIDKGILVDDAMATNIENIWAAGDAAQARDFFGDEKAICGILPAAVEQGRIAGKAMIGDPAIKPYPGGVPLNSYNFFGNQAVAVGISDEAVFGGAVEVFAEIDAAALAFRKILLRDDRLVGISGINTDFDPGIMWELILRAVDLGAVKKDFVARPRDTARELMSRIWR